MGLGGAALAVAEGNLDRVGSGGERLLLRGLGLEVEGDVVGPDRLAVVDDTVSEGLTVGGGDAEGNLTGTGGRGHVVRQSKHKGGPLGARLGRNLELLDVGSSVVVDRALLEELARVDWVRRVLLDDLDKLGNTDVVTHKVANSTLKARREEPAQVAARVDNTELDDSLDKLVLSLREPL